MILILGDMQDLIILVHHISKMVHMHTDGSGIQNNSNDLQIIL